MMFLKVARSKWNEVAFTASKLNGYRFYSASSAEVPANVPEPQISSTQVSQFKRGAGGRSSFSGNVITVFGGTGYIGPSIINHLAKQGNQLIITHRCDPYWLKEIKVVGDLGQILFFPFALDDEESIRKAVKYSNVVVNLIATKVHTKHYPMHAVNVEGARRIARIAREAGVERLVHLSCMGADPGYSPKIDKTSQFMQTKGLGEIAVREEFPQATIIRPSIIYGGQVDHFIMPFMTFGRKPPHDLVYTYKGGKQTFKMPIYAYDASLGISRAVMDPTAAGKTYELVGPYCYRMDNLLKYMYAKSRAIPLFGYHIRLHGWKYEPIFWMQSRLWYAFWTKIYRMPHTINFEWMEFCEASSDILTGEPLISELGVHRLAEFENAGGYWCFWNSWVRYLMERYGELEEPPLPIRSPPLRKEKLPIKVEEVRVEKKPFHRVAVGT